MPPVALAPRLQRARPLTALHTLSKRADKLTKTNIITLSIFLVILFAIILFFGIFVPRYTRKKRVRERRQALREMLATEERRSDGGRRRRAAGATGGGVLGGAGGGGAAGQRQGQGENIPMDSMMVPDGDGGWVEPPPPYVADPKPAYHP
ncbi:hypothetical protein B0T20DRAFT_395022 [Sordaria brevicollis]|uniref:Uncharacterized protein n=1 Tax=Sordaria brevicollis TaxID=83679 RepID=A0AAE0UA23_SORBR|nr:hypothetical protein B0T20DRAFT_395022 [Sordaria brevicollis]